MAAWSINPVRRSGECSSPCTFRFIDGVRLYTVEGEAVLIELKTQDEARLDISAVGVYAPFEKTYFDVRVTHPNCKTNIFKPLAQVYAEHEKAKKDAYEERVRESEKGSFIPLIFSTSGGMGPMTSVLVKRLSEKISDNSYEARSMVTNYIRTKIRFAILRSTLIALRGIRGRGKTMYHNISMDNISLNIIPHTRAYEVP